MSFHVFHGDLVSLVDEIGNTKSKARHSIASSNADEFDTRLDQLLEDLTDYSRAYGNEALTNKLASFARETNGYGFNRSELSEVEARALRIERALRTFGQRELEGPEMEPSIDVPPAKTSKSNANAGVALNRKVFVVHGHDEAAIHQVVRVLDSLGMEPIVLREQPNQGATIIEKFEIHSDVGFAVILMTADDMGATVEMAEAGNYERRARQNVILELGYFVGALGRERVCVLKADRVEEPSDIFGVVYTKIDENGAWKLLMAKELKAAGYNIDLNAL